MDAMDTRFNWMQVAERELGIAQFPPGASNPRIMEYHATTSIDAQNDKTAWCSSFVNWCFAQAGIPGTGSARARSWLDWGQAIDTPQPGCIAVLYREDPDSWKGHVGFFLRADNDHVYLLSGNQLEKVCVHYYPRTTVLGYRLPDAQYLPCADENAGRGAWMTRR